MSRTQVRVPDRERTLVLIRRLCPSCGTSMRIRYENRRTLVTLSGTVRLRLKIRRFEAQGCARLHTPYRPEAEGALALSQHEFGLDVVALVGALRHREHLSVPEIHAILRGRGARDCRAQRDQPARPLCRGACRTTRPPCSPAPATGRAGSDRPRPRWPAA